MPEHVGRSGSKLANFAIREVGPTEVPYMNDRMLTVVRRGQLGTLIGTLVVVLIRPVGRSPPGLVYRVGGGQDPDSLLAAANEGEVPNLDCSIYTGTEQMLAVWMPVDGGADALIVGGDFLLWAFVVAEVPALYGAIVGAKSELDGVGG